MATLLQLTQERRLLWGEHIARAAATLPQGANAPIFTIAGGRVLITALVGQVTVVLGSVGNMKLIATPSVGSAQDMCAVVAAGTLAAGTMLGITGAVGDAMVAQNGVMKGFSYDGIIVDVGTINLSLSGSSTGSVKWDLFYTSLDDGATVTAA